MSTIRRTHHAVYDLKYHLVWIPKYRKPIFTKEISKFTKEVFQEIARQYEFEIDTMEIMEDYVHLFLSAPPRFSPAEIVQIFKSISAREVFKRYPSLRKVLWKKELWNDGHFVRSVGDKVTSDVIRRYIQYQHSENQLRFHF
jgi:putative transposase